MRTTRQFAACLLVLIALSAWSEGPVVTIRSDHPLRNAPVTVPVPGGIDPSAAYVLKAGKEKLPVTIRENQLITIVPELAAGSEERYTLESAGKNRKPGVSIEQRGTEKVLEIKINGKPFTRYYYGEEWKKPFFWPITVEGGVGLTRDFPMDPKDKPQDHPHHKSMWSAFGNVNGANCWEENPGTGAQKVLDVTWESGDACGRIVSHDEWVDADGKHVATVQREYTFYNTPEAARLIDARVSFLADQGPIQFGDTKEGGIIALRMRGDICNAKAIITNALGDKGEDQCWGKPSPWCDFSGDIPKVGLRGAAIMDHPENLRYPSSWHVRAYGLMGANCFGYSFFNEKEYNRGLIPERGDYTVEAGKTLTFNYRVYIHSGDAAAADVAGRYADYVKPVEAAWK